MVAKLLANRIAPSSRSRVARSRLTIVASRLPCFSSRIMAAREDAVSAVSLAEKKADTAKHTATARTSSQSKIFIAWQASHRERPAHRACVDAGVDKCCADPAHQNECGHSALYFLVLRHQIDQPVDGRQLARNVLRPGGQADLSQMANGAVRFGGRQQTAPRGKLERQRHSGGDRFAVQKPPGKTGRRLQCMPEGMTEIEQLPIAGFALVARDNCRLGAAAYGDGVLAVPARL